MRLIEMERRGRRIAVCANCEEKRPMAAHGLCYRCYRRHTREQSKPKPFDAHSPGFRKEHRTLMTAHTQLLTALGKMRVSGDDVTTIRRVLDPYLIPVAEYVSLVNESAARRRRTKEVRQRLNVNGA